MPLTPLLEAKFEKAAQYHARANRTDPYAYDRMFHYLEAGYENPEEVIKAAKKQLGERDAG